MNMSRHVLDHLSSSFVNARARKVIVKARERDDETEAKTSRSCLWSLSERIMINSRGVREWDIPL